MRSQPCNQLFELLNYMEGNYLSIGELDPTGDNRLENIDNKGADTQLMLPVHR
ncbi:MAG: hypothetical protein RIC29_03975 [Rhodospirillaceae bacterium]